MIVTVRKPEPNDAALIGARLRAVDARECAAFGHSGPEAVALGIRASTTCWVAVGSHRPLAAFGVTPISLLDGLGRPWFLGTDEVRACWRDLLRLGPSYLATLERHFPRLENWVAQDNHASIRWLTRLGFAVDGELVDIGGLSMRRFTKGLTECAIPSP